MTARDVEYRADDRVMVGRLALPNGADTRPGVLVLYGGVEHSFTHPSADPDRTGLVGIKYDQDAADRSWRAMLELFEDVLG